MSSDETKRIAHDYLQRVVGDGDLEALDELVAEDVALYGGSGKLFEGRDALREILAKVTGAIERTSFEFECELAEGDTAVSVYTARGIHVDEYYGVQATRRELSTTAVNVTRVENGQIAEIRVFMDQSDVVRQLTEPETAACTSEQARAR